MNSYDCLLDADGSTLIAPKPKNNSMRALCVEAYGASTQKDFFSCALRRKTLQNFFCLKVFLAQIFFAAYYSVRSKKFCTRLRIMTLWHLLLALCCAMPMGMSIGWTKGSHSGFHGQMLSAAVGLTVGVCGAVIMDKAGGFIHYRTKDRPEPSRNRYARSVYFAAFLWIPFTGVLSIWLSSLLLRHVL